jgi:hypothetical protein
MGRRLRAQRGRPGATTAIRGERIFVTYCPLTGLAFGVRGEVDGTAYLFEPMAAIHPVRWLTVFVSPGNMLLKAGLATLLNVNVAVASYQVATARSCRVHAFGSGLACCAPALLLAIGAGFAAALAPAVAPLRSWLFPAIRPVDARHPALDGPASTRRYDPP